MCVCARFRCVCVCASDVCAENFSHSARLLLQQSRASFMLTSCLRAVLISSPDTWDWMIMHVLKVMHRRTLYENVDSAKIKVIFILQISIFYAWHRCIMSSYIVSIHIDESLHPYSQPVHFVVFLHLQPFVWWRSLILSINWQGKARQVYLYSTFHTHW